MRCRDNKRQNNERALHIVPNHKSVQSMRVSSEQQTFSIEIHYIITFEELTTRDRA